MPMPYYIFPNAFSEPKAERGDATSAPCVSPPPPWSAALPCAPSAEAQWLHLRHRDPSVLTSVLVSGPKAGRGDATSAPASLLHILLGLSSTSVVYSTALCALGRGPVASSQTQRPLCPERSQKKKIHLFPVCVAGAVIRHWSCRSSAPKGC